MLAGNPRRLDSTNSVDRQGHYHRATPPLPTSPSAPTPNSPPTPPLPPKPTPLAPTLILSPPHPTPTSTSTPTSTLTPPPPPPPPDFSLFVFSDFPKADSYIFSFIVHYFTYISIIFARFSKTEFRTLRRERERNRSLVQ